MGDVGLGLVVVVVGHKELDGVAGKEFFELGGELGGQGLVVGHHQRGALHPLDDVGHGEGLAAAGHAHEGLPVGALDNAVDQAIHSFRLVAGHAEV